MQREIKRHFSRNDNQPLDGYACIGSVRGHCGHVHRKLTAAIRCQKKDQRSCNRSATGGYSDRKVVRIEDGEPVGWADDYAYRHASEKI